MKTGNEYTNLTNGSVIRIVEVNSPHEVVVITLVNSNGEETSQQRKRKMNTNVLHDTVVKDNGDPRTSGWVLISDTEPVSNKTVSAAAKKENVVTASISPGAQSWDEVDLSKMSQEALIQSAHKLDIQAKEAKDALDLIKEELKKRIVGRGTAVAGDSVMTVTVNTAFSPELAKKHLTPAQVETFTVPTLDAKAIKAYLGEKSPEYQRLLVPAATTVKLRMVTEADAKAAAAGRLADPFKKG